MKHRVLLLMLAVLVVAATAGCQQATEKKPTPNTPAKPQAADVKTLQELAAKDPYDKGCVSCHKKEGDVDRSLPAYVKRIAGHPDVRETTVNACYNCHEAQKNFEWYKAFTRGLHKAHWKSETFYSKLNGRCWSCHTVESNGVSGIKEYPVAGFRSALGARESQPKAQQPPAGQIKPEETKKSTEKAKQGQESQKATPGKSSTGEEVPTPTP